MGFVLSQKFLTFFLDFDSGKKPIFVRKILKIFGFFVYNSKENKYMPPLSEKFRAAIEKGVRDIDTNGELRKLNAPEKRQLLADLRKRGDCPDGWKNKKNMTPKKQKSILKSLHEAIERLLDPEKVKAGKARSKKRRIENGKAQAYTKKYTASGKQKAANDRFWAKVSQALREANAQAILDNKDHKEPTWDEATLERLATEIVKYIVDKCGRNGFVHVFGGAWAGKDLNEAAEAECFGKGRGRHAVFIDDTYRKFVRYRDVSTHVKLFTPYTGTNCLNADDLEERVQKKLLDLGWPQHRRMFTKAGAGTCKGPATGWTTMPFPYYTGVLVCEQSMEQIGIRLATKKDHAPKRKRSSSSL